MTITSGVRCEVFNASINGSLVLSHISDEGGMGLSVDLGCTNSLDRYELVEVAQTFFKRIGIAGEHSGNVIHLDVDKTKPQEGVVDLLKIEETLLTFSQGRVRRVSTYYTFRRISKK